MKKPEHKLNTITWGKSLHITVAGMLDCDIVVSWFSIHVITFTFGLMLLGKGMTPPQQAVG